MTETDNNMALAPAKKDSMTWRPLRILCSYRVAVATLLLLGFLSSRAGTTLLSTPDPNLFLYTALLYLAFAAAALIFSLTQRYGYDTQVVTQVTVDVIAIATMIHAAGGVEAGLGVLMVVAVAGGSLLVGVRLGTFFAALATLAMFFEHALTHLADGGTDAGYTRVAFLGIATFATALTGSLLARRAKENEALAERRGVDVANLEALNAHIVQRLETGVVALDPQGGIRLTNSTAREMLGQRQGAGSPTLADASPVLAARFVRWRETWDVEESPIATTDGATEYVPRFQPLGPGGENGTLIFLENVTQMRAQVQQAKLASLGRLTASIAHEVRNPLAAMLQAAQLLGEAEYLKRGDL
ncbi:MAG TPA: ATPase, partial [Gammaproteobacteria bacterium]|nr:ATPase [Gammaproteobacteria bacterium]